MKWRLMMLSAAMSAVVLTAPAGVFAQSGADAPASPLDWRFDPAFKDPDTGRSYYNAVAFPDGGWPVRRIVYADPDGSWHALPDNYRDVIRHPEDGNVYVSPAEIYGDMLSDKLYDISSDTVTNETLYEMSPDGRRGVRELTDYVYEPMKGYGGAVGQQKMYSLFAKDMETGVVRKLAMTPRSQPFEWLKDGRMLMMIYNEAERQNEIVTYDPKTGREERVVLASMRGYDSVRNLILFAYNEPSRTEHIYDLNTGKTRLASNRDIRLFYPPQPAPDSVAPNPKPDIMPPAGLDPVTLPVEPVAERTLNEASAVIDGRSVALPYAFISDGKTWIPARALVDALGAKTEKLSEYSFRVSLGEKSLVTDSGDSLVTGSRLMLDRSALERLGLTLQSVSWNAGSGVDAEGNAGG